MRYLRSFTVRAILAHFCPRAHVAPGQPGEQAVSGPARFQSLVKVSALQLAPCSPPFSDLLLRGGGAHCHLSLDTKALEETSSRRTGGLSYLPSILHQVWTCSRGQESGIPAPPHASLSPRPAPPSAPTLKHSHGPSSIPSLSAGL